MEPILIVAYPAAIAAEQTWLDTQIAYFQSVYDMFKDAGMTVTLPEITNIRHDVLSANDGYLRTLIEDKMIAKAGNPTFNGQPIKRHKLVEMLVIPDDQPIRKWIRDNTIKGDNSFNLVYGSNDQANKPALPAYRYKPDFISLTPDLLEIVADVVRRKATTNDIIEAKHSFYTKNDKGVQTYEHLMDFRDIVDSFNQRLEEHKATFRVPYFGLHLHPDGVMRPALDVIRANEAKYPDDYVFEA